MLGNFAAHCITMDGCIWCTLANMTCGIECTVLRSTFVLQGQLYVDKVDCSTHRAVNCDDSHQRWKLAGTSGLFSQRGRSERPVPNVPADINALILRGRCGRPMCETQGGGGQNVGANRSSARSRSNLAANEPVFTSGSLHLGRYPNGERSRPPWWGSRCRGHHALRAP